MRLADLKIDDDFKNLLPELDAETYTALEKDIVSNGVLDPIITWNGYIADGHNRYEICKAHYINEVQTRPLNKATKSDVMAWIVDHQFAKRNLLKSEQVWLLLKVKKQIAKEAKDRKLSSLKQNTDTSNLTERKSEGETAEIMAKKLGVSKNTWKDMETIVTQGTPKQIERMDKGGKGNGASTIAREIKMGATDEERVCSSCGKIKPIADFPTNASRRNICFECKRKQDSESRKRTHEKIMVMPDTLNPDVKEEITDDIIISKFANILRDARDSFEMLLKYEQHMTDNVIKELPTVISEHIEKMKVVKERITNETKGESV